MFTRFQVKNVFMIRSLATSFAKVKNSFTITMLAMLHSRVAYPAAASAPATLPEAQLPG